MKAKSTGGIPVHMTGRALSLGAAAFLAIGSMAVAADEFGQRRGSTFDEVGREWAYGPGEGTGLGSISNRYGELGTPRMERQSRFYGPGQHRVSGFGKAQSIAPGRYVHGPGGGGRGR